MANPTMEGVVRLKSRNGKSFVIDGEQDANGQDIWWSAFSPDQCSDVGPGDSVEFEYKINTKRNDTTGQEKTFYNVQKNVRVIQKGVQSYSKTVGSGKAPQPAPTPTPTVGAVLLHRDRCIARQNACNVAAQVMQSMTFSEPHDHKAMSEIHRDIAMFIEDYTTGDLDVKEAEEAEEALKKEPAVESNDEAAPQTLADYD